MTYTQGLQTAEQTDPIISYLLDRLKTYGDMHNFFLHPGYAKSLNADSQTDEAPKPEARYLGNGVGYVAVPRFWGVNDTRETVFASQIQRLIQGVDTAQTVTSWVVDLRGNTGGNVWPMVAGLVPLYGKQVRDQYKRVTKVPNPYRLRNPPNRVAMLIAGQTGSSGEFTALSFVGLPHVRSFGTRSTGYTTGNGDYRLPDGAMLFIAEGVGKDQAGQKYPHGIAPDEEIKAQATDTTDPTLARRSQSLAEKAMRVVFYKAIPILNPSLST